MTIPKAIEEAIDSYVPTLQGWTTTARCKEMVGSILESQAKICVDIGVFAGISTLAMGFAARELGDAHVYGIDPWRNEVAADNDDNKEGVDWWKDKVNLEDIQRQAADTIWSHHLERWVTLIRNKSENVYQLFPVIEFLNIDGGHSEITSCRDVELYLPRLKSGCFLGFDDCGWATTQKAIRMVEEVCDLVNETSEKTVARIYKKR